MKTCLIVNKLGFIGKGFSSCFLLQSFISVFFLKTLFIFQSKFLRVKMKVEQRNAVLVCTVVLVRATCCVCLSGVQHERQGHFHRYSQVNFIQGFM